MSVFVIRLSAIGDAIIAGRAITHLRNAGCNPVFVTWQACFDIAVSVVGLNHILIADGNGGFRFFSRTKPGTGAECFADAELSAFCAADKKHSILDLQSTGRSRRCAAQLQRKIGSCDVARVRKRTLFRVWLLVLAWLHFSQTKRKRNFVALDAVRIHQLQEAFLRSWLQQNQISSAVVVPAHFPYLAANDAGVLATFTLQPKNYLVVAVGASGNLKIWPKEKFRALISKILADSAWNVVVVGATSDEPVALYLQHENAGRVRNAAGKTTLAETLSLIQNAAYVVTGDSFAGHAADAMSVPVSVVFGATTPLFGFVPFGKGATIEYADLNCSPCTRHGGGKCRFQNLKCHTAISVEQIAVRATSADKQLS